jgi:hypothetical protein
MRSWHIILAAVVLTAALPVAAQEWDPEQSSLYGYLVSYTHIGADQWEEPVVGHILVTRLKGDWQPQETIQFHLEASWTASLGAQNPYPWLESQGLAPAPQADEPYEDFINTVVLDHAWGLVNLGRVDLQLGKMPIGWGTGYLFNPTARTASAGLLDTVTEETPGTVAVAPTLYLTDFFSILGYLAFEDRSGKTQAFSADADLQNLPYGLKLQLFLGAFDVTTGVVKEVLYGADGHRRRLLAVLDLDGGVGGLGLYGEAAVRLPRSAGESLELSERLDAVAGGYYTVPALDLEVRVEYFHQGSGRRRRGPDDLLVQLSGERLVLAEDYLFVSGERLFRDYLTVMAGGLVNLNDGSLVMMPEASYSVYDNFEVALGSTILLGDDGTEFGDAPTDPVGVYLRGKLSF